MKNITTKIYKTISKVSMVGFISKPVYKSFLVFSALLFSVLVPLQIITPSVYAQCSTVSECESKINEIENNITVFRQQAQELSNQISTLQGYIDRLVKEKSIIQAQIDVNQVKYDQLLIQIADTEKKILDNRDALGKTIADLYVGDDITSIEMLAGSANISDYLDKQEYRSSVRNQLSDTIAKIKDLKKSLDEQKIDSERVLNEQKNARQALVDKESEQQTILAQTKGQESEYQSLIKENQNAKDDLAQQQQNIIAAAQKKGGSVTGISDPSKGNYPWGGNGCYVAYVWNGYSMSLDSFGGDSGDGYDPLMYACRQCTSYAAWKVLEYTGESYRYLGNANNWWRRFPSSQVHDTARANAVGVMDGGTYGHVVWVETNPDSEGYIIISQYNDWAHNTGDNSGNGWGNYSKIRVHQSAYDHFIYF